MALSETQQAIVEGHGTESVPVESFQAALQKFKKNHVDPKVSSISFDAQTGKIKQTANGTTSDVVQVYTKEQIDAKRSPTYDRASKRITFPATATFTYQRANKKIILSH